MAKANLGTPIQATRARTRANPIANRQRPINWPMLIDSPSAAPVPCCENSTVTCVAVAVGTAVSVGLQFVHGGLVLVTVAGGGVSVGVGLTNVPVGVRVSVGVSVGVRVSVGVSV